MIAVAADLIVRAVIDITGGCLIAAGIVWLDREIGRGLSRRRD